MYRTEEINDRMVAVVDGDGLQLVLLNGEMSEMTAKALCGVLNSAEAGQALEITLANLAAGRHA